MKLTIYNLSPNALYTLMQMSASDIEASLDDFDDQYVDQAILARSELINYAQSLKSNFPLVYQDLVIDNF